MIKNQLLSPPKTGGVRDGLSKLAALVRRARLAMLDKLVLLALVAAACASPTKEELASLAAKGYYQHLIDGDYEHFLEGREMADSLPADYRSQLIDGYSQFLAQQLKARRGINEVRVSRAFTDSTQNYTSVLLMLCFGDSTTEEVVVPMVERHGRWMMK